MVKRGDTVYLIGICGTGMAALAGLLKEEGFSVIGSDSGCYPPMDAVLRDLNIEVLKGYHARNMKRSDPGLVIIGNVVRSDNPEAQYVLQNSIPYMSFPQALGEFFLSRRRPLVVTGTHGKTTTSSMLVSALTAAGQDPGFMIGGVPVDEKRGFRTGTSPWFVVEGDEYDTSFFQKVSKFLFYRPFCGIITSIEFDHADIFNNLDEIKQSFKKFAMLVPRDGALVCCMDWDDVMDVTRNTRARVITYGQDKDADWCLEDVWTGDGFTHFSFSKKGRKKRKLEAKIKLPGEHNALNALSVIALLDFLGFELEPVIKGLSQFQGVKRRQEIRGMEKDIIVIDDFAHHPRAVKETLKALKERYGDRRLIAVFEPRTNTSRRAVFQDRYKESFDHADMVIVRAVPDPEKFPKDNRFSSSRLVTDLKKRGVSALFFEDARQIIDGLVPRLERGDVIACLSNGPFEGIHEGLLAAIRTRNDL